MFSEDEITELLLSRELGCAEWGGFDHANDIFRAEADFNELIGKTDWQVIGYAYWVTFEESGHYWLLTRDHRKLYMLQDVYSVMADHADVTANDIEFTTIREWLDIVASCNEYENYCAGT